MSTFDHATFRRRNEVRHREVSMPADVPVRRYLRAMELGGELLPGSTGLIARHLELHRLKPEPLSTGVPALDKLLRVVSYLSGEGAKFKNPEFKSAADQPELKSILLRFGLPTDARHRYYTEHAAALAGRTGATLMAAVFHDLAELEDGRYLGVGEQPASSPSDRGSSPPRGLPAGGL